MGSAMRDALRAVMAANRARQLVDVEADVNQLRSGDADDQHKEVLARVTSLEKLVGTHVDVESRVDSLEAVLVRPDPGGLENRIVVQLVDASVPPATEEIVDMSMSQDMEDSVEVVDLTQTAVEFMDEEELTVAANPAAAVVCSC